MNKKLKLALATLLGFSAACSTVKNAPPRARANSNRKPVRPKSGIRLHRVMGGCTGFALRTENDRRASQRSRRSACRRRAARTLQPRNPPTTRPIWTRRQEGSPKGEVTHVRRRLGLRKRLALNIFSDLYSSTVAEHRLDTLFWECTLRCNLSCRHCGSDCRVIPVCGHADRRFSEGARRGGYAPCRPCAGARHLFRAARCWYAPTSNAPGRRSPAAAMRGAW